MYHKQVEKIILAIPTAILNKQPLRILSAIEHCQNYNWRWGCMDGAWVAQSVKCQALGFHSVMISGS